MRSIAAGLCAWTLATLAGAPARADALVERVDRTLNEQIRADGPGCTVGVARDGELVMARGYGLANLDHAVPNGPDTVFDVSSVAVQFTAAAVQLLARRGQLSLDDPVRRYVPELPAYGEPVRIRHLIHHTSGIRDYIELETLAGMTLRDVTGLDDLVALIARQRELNFEPGQEYLYSSSGYILLALVAERVSGESLAALLEREIFEPLGMDHTLVYDDPTRVIPHRATGYDRRPGGGYAVDHLYDFAVPGDGQLYTTVGDLAHWDRAFGENTLGGPGFMASLLEPGRLADGTELDYAFGLRLGELRGLPTVWHGGSWGGFRAQFLRFPDQNLAVMCLCNDGRARPDELAEAVAAVYLEDQMQPAPAPETPRFRPSIVALEAAAGTFRDAESGEVWELRLRRGELQARSLGGGPFHHLEPLAPGRFRVADLGDVEEIHFEAGRAGRRQLRLQRAGAESALFVEIEPVEPDRQQLRAYAGAYRSDELDATWTLRAEDGSLTVEIGRGGVRFRLWPGTRDVFLSDERVLEFERDAQGAVVGVRVQAGRVKNLRFSKLPS